MTPQSTLLIRTELGLPHPYIYSRNDPTYPYIYSRNDPTYPYIYSGNDPTLSTISISQEPHPARQIP